jgi:hypothetical protein
MSSFELLFSYSFFSILIFRPPGTGKTFIGVKLVKLLLNNKDLWWNQQVDAAPNRLNRRRRIIQRKPILMICYTNHALDQFLELIIKECKLNRGVVRVGGRSKAENLSAFLLRNIKSAMRAERKIEQFVHHGIRDAYTELKSLREVLTEKTNKVILGTNEILSMECLSKYMNESNLDWFLMQTNHNSNIDLNVVLLNWLGFFSLNDINNNKRSSFDFNEIAQLAKKLTISKDDDYRQTSSGQARSSTNDRIKQNENNDEGDDDDDEDEAEAEALNEEILKQNQERMLDDDGFELVSGRASAPKKKSGQIQNEDYYENKIRVVLSTEEIGRLIEDSNKAADDGVQWTQAGNKKKLKKKLLEKVRAHIELIVSFSIFSPPRKSLSSSSTTHNVWRMDYTERFVLYNEWTKAYKKEKQIEIDSLKSKYNEYAAKYKEMRMQEDRQIMQDALIIAMTTSGSARYHKILNDIGPKIVIVEEAAEVFESHIVSSLSGDCEHLILIGDHIQLRPNPNVYHLAKNYHLDVSLFERLLNNNIKKEMLTCQHRMRPEVSALMRFFYNEAIVDNENVLAYPKNILGLKHPVYFINHQYEERADKENQSSKSNLFEADYVASLAQYLVKNKYLQEKITIITMYLGQMAEIKTRLRQLGLKEVRVFTVDNYQGEENDIILLSLVRSNRNNSIGFLNIINRVCVALSRAKHALYCIGNFELLRAKSPKWNEIITFMEEKQFVGKGVALTCYQHPVNDIVAQMATDFVKRPDGLFFLFIAIF